MKTLFKIFIAIIVMAGCASCSNNKEPQIASVEENIEYGELVIKVKFTDETEMMFKEDEPGELSLYSCKKIPSSGKVIIPSKITFNGVDYKVTNIGAEAFVYCRDLTSITIPNSVTSIGGGAFGGCSSLTSINIPNSVTSIGRGAFAECERLTSVTIPNSVESIGSFAFHETAWYDNQPEGLVIIGKRLYCYKGDMPEGTSITIPNSVTSIGGEAFYGCSGLTSIIVPNSVTSIGERAFEYCRDLISITVPNSVTSIGGFAFNETAWYDDQPEGLIIIGSSLYGYKGDMPEGTSITIPNSVTSIGVRAFEGCSGLASITIPNSVTSIGEGAFCGCPFRGSPSLTSITIPQSVLRIGENAFKGCYNLSSVIIQNPNLTFDFESVFSDCYLLDHSRVVYQKGTSYEPYSNGNESKIVSVEENNEYGTTYIKVEYDDETEMKFKKEQGELELCLCENKKGTASDPLIIPSTITSKGVKYKVTSIGEDPFLCRVKSVVIPNTVTNISQRAFSQTGLTSITIPNSVVTIGRKAFQVTNLVSVTIPNSVTSIGEEAFAECERLTSVIIQNPDLTIDFETVFPDCDNLSPSNVVRVGEDGSMSAVSNGSQSASVEQSRKVYANAYDGFVNIRQSPQSKAPIVGVLRNGPEGAVLLGTEGEWKKVDCNGIVGYVYAKYVQDTPTEVFQEQ